MEKDREQSSISKSRSIAEMAKFWDSHDATAGMTRPKRSTSSLIFAPGDYIAVDPDLLIRLRELAYERGLSAESLANLMLQEKVFASES